MNLVMSYNDWYLRNTLLIGNHFPYIAIALLMLLVLAFNVGLRRAFRAETLSAGELMVVWGMIGVAGGIGSAGFMRYFPSYMAAPAYYASSSNEWGTFVLKYIPDWMVLSHDPNSKAVKWFMEGLPRGGTIPWAAWLVPMAAWFLFMGLLYASNFALVALFYHQWTVRERLIFPVVQLPALMAEEAPSGGVLNAFLGNRLTWIGACIPLLIWGVNGLRSYLPGIPAFPMSWYSWTIFSERPWDALHLNEMNVYFTVIGMTFLLTTEIAFSLWFIFILYKLSYVYISWLGSGATGFWGNWWASVTVYETAGCILAITAFLFWTARRGLKEWLGRAVAGKRDAEADPLAPRITLAMLVIGVAGMVAWFVAGGTQWWAAVIGVVMFLSVLLVLTRIVAESGLVFVQSNVIPYDLLTGIFPPAWLSGFTLNAMALQKGIHMFDLREIFMPYVVNGVKGAAQAKVSAGKVLAVLMLTAGVAVLASAYGKVATSYKYGGVNMDLGANVTFPSSFLGAPAKFQKNPPNFEFVKTGERRLLPVNVTHVIVGGVTALGMLVLRTKFLWWPLHPFGIVMCGTWAMQMFWFSILIGWMAKAFVMSFMGASRYRRILPLFLGMVLGECLAATLWALTGLITGTPGISILPY